MPGKAEDSEVRRMMIALPGNELFAKDLAEIGGYELGALETRQFPDGESYIRLLSDVRDRHVHLVCTLARPDHQFLRLIFAADAARDLGAAEVSLVAPYLCYMRQDRRFKPGEAVTSRAFARMVSSSFDSLVTIDAHLHRYGALEEIYTIPARNLQAAPVMAKWISENVAAPFLIGPDEESEQWVSGIAALSGAPFAVLKKTRHGDRAVEIELPDLREWKARQPVLIDDIASSGRTLIEAARQVGAQGLQQPICAVVHSLFAENAYQELSALSLRIVSTNSIGHQSNAMPITEIIAAAIGNSGSRPASS